MFSDQWMAETWMVFPEWQALFERNWRTMWGSLDYIIEVTNREFKRKFYGNDAWRSAIEAHQSFTPATHEMWGELAIA